MNLVKCQQSKITTTDSQVPTLLVVCLSPTNPENGTDTRQADAASMASKFLLSSFTSVSTSLLYFYLINVLLHNILATKSYFITRKWVKENMNPPQGKVFKNI